MRTNITLNLSQKAEKVYRYTGIRVIWLSTAGQLRLGRMHISDILTLCTGTKCATPLKKLGPSRHGNLVWIPGHKLPVAPYGSDAIEPTMGGGGFVLRKFRCYNFHMAYVAKP